MMEEPTKGKIFDNLINAVSSRDEKEALETAKKHILEMESKVAGMQKQLESLQTTLLKAQADLKSANDRAAAAEKRAVTAESDLKAASGKISALEQRATSAEFKLKQMADREAMVQHQAAAAEAAKAKIIATHKLTSKESLSHLALQYYGHATEPYWRLIYEANKDAIGPNPNKVRVGTLLEIPVLPDSMK